MPIATAADGRRLHYTVHGREGSPALLIGYPWNDGMAHMAASLVGGAIDPADIIASNAQLIAALAEDYRVVHMDYPRAPLPGDAPAPVDLTVDTVASDHVAIADSAGVGRFVLVGYSWSTNAALQVASRTDRCAGLVVGGWPPLSAPYREVLTQLDAQLAALGPDFPNADYLRMIANNYRSVLRDWDEEREVARLSGPRLCFCGADDVGAPEAGLSAPTAERIRARRPDLERLGWTVVELAGHTHTPPPNSVLIDIVRGKLAGLSW